MPHSAIFPPFDSTLYMNQTNDLIWWAMILRFHPVWALDHTVNQDNEPDPLTHLLQPASISGDQLNPEAHLDWTFNSSKYKFLTLLGVTVKAPATSSIRIDQILVQLNPLIMNNSSKRHKNFHWKLTEKQVRAWRLKSTVCTCPSLRTLFTWMLCSLVEPAQQNITLTLTSWVIVSQFST